MFLFSRLPADVVFVETGDNVQRIYVPRKPDEVHAKEKQPSDHLQGKSSASKAKEPADILASTQVLRTNALARNDIDFVTSKVTADKKETTAGRDVMRTPPRSGRSGRDGDRTPSPQSTSRRSSHQIYSPAGLTTPSRTEHSHIATKHQGGMSTNQTPSPGVAFMKRGTQSTGKIHTASVNDDNNHSDLNYAESAPAPNARYNTTTKLDTLREEATGFDDIPRLRNSVHPIGIGGGTSLLLDADEGGAPTHESRRLFLEESSVTTAHSDSLVIRHQPEDEEQSQLGGLYCPLCSVQMCNRIGKDASQITEHLHKVL